LGYGGVDGGIMWWPKRVMWGVRREQVGGPAEPPSTRPTKMVGHRTVERAYDYRHSIYRWFVDLRETARLHLRGTQFLVEFERIYGDRVSLFRATPVRISLLNKPTVGASKTARACLSWYPSELFT